MWGIVFIIICVFLFMLMLLIQSCYLEDPLLTLSLFVVITQ